MKFVHETVKIANDIGVKFEHQHYASNSVSPHWHNSLELVYVKEGEFEVFTNGQTIRVQKEELIIINSRQVHASITRNPNEAILLQIPYQFLQANVDNFDNLNIDCTPLTPLTDTQQKSLSQLKNVITEFSQLYQSKTIGYKLKATSLIFDVLYLISSQFSTYSNKVNQSKSDKYFDRLGIITKYVQAHYTESLDLNTLADLVGLNPEYFSRFFKKYMGITFLKYLNSVRLDHVYLELLNTDYSISEIIERNGFTNYKIFMSLFKETYHCTPSELRKRHNS